MTSFRLNRDLNVDTSKINFQDLLPNLNTSINDPTSQGQIVYDPIQATVAYSDNTLTWKFVTATIPSKFNVVYVDQNGNDSPGSGGFGNPYKTISYAMSQITTASPSSRWAIVCGIGTFTNNITIKANVFIVGVPELTRISGTIDINSTTWTTDSDHRSGLINVVILNSLTLDFLSVTSNQGKFYCNGVKFNLSPSITGYSLINQIILDKCYMFAGFTISGGVLFISSTTLTNGGTYTITGSTGVTTIVALCSGCSDGNMSITQSGLQQSVTVENYGISVIGTLTVDGSNASYSSVAIGIPVRTNISILNSATLARYNDTYALGYTPNPSSNWAAPAPTYLQTALDRMATLLKALNGGVAIPN